MANVLIHTPKLIEQTFQRRESLDTIVQQGIYEMFGVDATLASMNLEVGDALPDDANAEILESRLMRVKGTASDQAIVTARTFRFYSGAVTPLWELANSRTQHNTQHLLTFIERYIILRTNIEEGAAGWVATGASGGTLPVKGDAYGHGTWTNLVTPVVADVQVKPEFSILWSLITVRYTAPRAHQ